MTQPKTLTPGQAARELGQAVEDAINDIVDCYHPQLDSNTVLSIAAVSSFAP